MRKRERNVTKYYGQWVRLREREKEREKKYYKQSVPVTVSVYFTNERIRQKLHAKHPKMWVVTCLRVSLSSCLTLLHNTVCQHPKTCHTWDSLTSYPTQNRVLNIEKTCYCYGWDLLSAWPRQHWVSTQRAVFMCALCPCTLWMQTLDSSLVGHNWMAPAKPAVFNAPCYRTLSHSIPV